VFAVAITLVALNLAVSGPGRGALLNQHGQQWPVHVAYVVSFLVIGVLWVDHHSLFGQVERVDRGLLYANLCLLLLLLLLLFVVLLLLLFVVVIPFITSTLADYLRAGGQDARVAAVLYAVVMEGMGLSFTLMFAYAVRAGAYLVAIGVAFVPAPLVLVIAGAITAYYIFERVPSGPPTGPAGSFDILE
jgi:uncharacterized membrane protein